MAVMTWCGPGSSPELCAAEGEPSEAAAAAEEVAELKALLEKYRSALDFARAELATARKETAKAEHEARKQALMSHRQKLIAEEEQLRAEVQRKIAEEARERALAAEKQAVAQAEKAMAERARAEEAALAARKVTEEYDQIFSEANPILDNLLEGMKTGDFATYARDFGALMRQKVDEDGFRRSLDATERLLGAYKSRQPLGFLKRKGMTIVLWKGRFSQTDDDVLIKLVVEKEDDKTVVSGLWFE